MRKLTALLALTGLVLSTAAFAGEAQGCPQVKACCADKAACCKDGASCCTDNAACCKDGAACCKDTAKCGTCPKAKSGSETAKGTCPASGNACGKEGQAKATKGTCPAAGQAAQSTAGKAKVKTKAAKSADQASATR